MVWIIPAVAWEANSSLTSRCREVIFPTSASEAKISLTFRHSAVMPPATICSAVMDEHDGVVYYTAVLDATAAVETEKKLAWQAERYRLLSENQSSVTFDYDTRNQNFRRLNSHAWTSDSTAC